MGENPLENAEKRRDRIAAEINALQAKIEQKRKDLERVNAFIRDYEMFSVGEPELEFGEVTVTRPPLALTEKKHVNPDKEAVGDAVAGILTAYGAPLPRDPLFREVANMGLIIKGKDPLMVFSTMLWRMQTRFVRLPGKAGYWFADRAWPPAGYYPPSPPLSETP